nr:unnamed protein product [Callosobruchus analis]
MERILDLVISDTDAETTKDSSPLIRDDLYHPSLSIMWNINSNNTSSFESRSSTTYYNFRKANYIGLYNALSYIDWSILDGISDVNMLCDLFYERLYYVLDLYVPKFTNRKSGYPKWCTLELINNIKKRHRLHKKYVL